MQISHFVAWLDVDQNLSIRYLCTLEKLADNEQWVDRGFRLDKVY